MHDEQLLSHSLLHLILFFHWLPILIGFLVLGKYEKHRERFATRDTPWRRYVDSAFSKGFSTPLGLLLLLVGFGFAVVTVLEIPLLSATPTERVNYSAMPSPGLGVGGPCLNGSLDENLDCMMGGGFGSDSTTAYRLPAWAVRGGVQLVILVILICVTYFGFKGFVSFYYILAPLFAVLNIGLAVHSLSNGGFGHIALWCDFLQILSKIHSPIVEWFCAALTIFGWLRLTRWHFED